jgi:hypothetical protein
MGWVLRMRRCPCGSGRRSSRCCGGAATGRRDASAALQEAFLLPSHFPRLRARGPGAARWVTVVISTGLDDDLVESGVAALGEEERRRIVRECARRQRHVWRTLVREVGSAERAAEALISGAVVAAAVERMPPASGRLAYLEEGAVTDPAEALALALRPDDLWSVVETAELGEALAGVDTGLDEEVYELHVEAAAALTARRLATSWHAKRLGVLVERVALQLPYPGHPRASSALARACGAFDRHPAVGPRLATLLLVDSLSSGALPGAVRASARRAA